MCPHLLPLNEKFSFDIIIFIRSKNYLLLKLTLISTILNHGLILQEIGTGLTVLFSMNNLEEINVVTWIKDGSESLEFKKNVYLHECYNPNHPISIFRTLKKVIKDDSDLFIYNIMPTAYGTSIIANFVGLISPIILKIFFHKKVIVIYHNSIHTNDFKALGYYGANNFVKSIVIKTIEKLMFKTVVTCFLSPIYTSHIQSINKNFKVKTLELPYLQTIGTLKLNNILDKEFINNSPNIVPIILLFGNWGPQKDPENSLKTLKKLHDSGVQFKLIIAGDINIHFPLFKDKISRLFKTYSEIIYKNLGRVKEKDLMGLYLNSDLIILDYKAPGGFSSVLAIAIFFQKFIISKRFSEFISQAKDYKKIIFYQDNELEQALRKYIYKIHPNLHPEEIKICDKIETMNKEIESLLF